MGWATGLISGGLQAGANKKQGEKDEAAAESQQILANYQADDALNRGSIEEQLSRRNWRTLMGRQRNEIGARNVELRGSALRLLEDSAMMDEEDAVTIRNNAARESWGYRNQANEASAWGKNQKSNANAAATSSLLTGAAQSYGQWYSQKYGS